MYWHIVVYWRNIIHYTNLLLHNGMASVKYVYIYICVCVCACARAYNLVTLKKLNWPAELCFYWNVQFTFYAGETPSLVAVVSRTERVTCIVVPYIPSLACDYVSAVVSRHPNCKEDTT